jgi:hypothetical protein
MSLTDQLEAFFRAHPNEWHDGRRLAVHGGFYAYRTRCSDLRKKGLDIRNRQRKVTKLDGSHYVVSEYMFVAASLLDLVEGAADSAMDSTREASL